MVDAGLQQERADLALTERELDRTQSRLTRLAWAADRIKLIGVKLPSVEQEMLLTQKALADLLVRRAAILQTIAELDSEFAADRMRAQPSASVQRQKWIVP